MEKNILKNSENIIGDKNIEDDSHIQRKNSNLISKESNKEILVNENLELSSEKENNKNTEKEFIKKDNNRNNINHKYDDEKNKIKEKKNINDENIKIREIKNKKALDKISEKKKFNEKKRRKSNCYCNCNCCTKFDFNFCCRFCCELTCQKCDIF